MSDFPKGSVWLVGAGPGDPELLTRKAERLLKEADIVFHDALVSQGILDLIPRGTAITSVGKRAGRHSAPQPLICDLIVKAAQSGQRVVRLKGGDPSIFGRSEEEITACQSNGVPVQVCAGVTTASAASYICHCPHQGRRSARAGLGSLSRSAGDHCGLHGQKLGPAYLQGADPSGTARLNAGSLGRECQPAR